MLSMMLSNPLTDTKKIVKQYKILLLWSISNVIICTFYSGSITSIIISPPLEETISSFSELAARNFTLIFDLEHQKKLVSATIQAYSGLKITGTLGRDIKSLKSLLANRTLVLNAGKLEFGRNLAFGIRTAAVYADTSLLGLRNMAMEAMEMKSGGGKRRCYIGKRFVAHVDSYRFFSPPFGKKIAKVLNKLESTGFVAFWMQEFAGLQYSRRVQDRLRVKSPTKIIFEHDGNEPRPLKLNEKPKLIFFLLVLGESLAVLMMAVEGITNWIKNRRQQTFTVFEFCE